MKIYVIFSTSPSRDLLRGINVNDCVITDQNISLPCTLIDCSKITINHHKLIKELYKVIGSINKPDLIQPYANNFYECSILPLMRFYTGIENVLDEFNGEIREFVFEAGLENKFISTYYMAEGESQGYRWYDRAAVLSPYLIQFLKKRGIKYKIITPCSKKKQWFFEKVRTYGVFFAKFLRSLKDYICYPYLSTKENNEGAVNSSSKKNPYDCLIISRSTVQTTFFKPYIESTKKNVALLVGEITVAFGANIKLATRLFQSRKSKVFPLANRVDVFRLLGFYFEALQHMLGIMFRPRWFAVGDYKINLREAILEIIVMSPELLLYEYQLKRCLAKHVSTSANPPPLFTSEQKSPHAFIDGKVAKFFNMKCLQFMACDQMENTIPIPVAGDAFLVDTPRNLERFRKNFPGDKFYYLGTLKALNNKKRHNNRSGICYFTCPGTPEVNRHIISLLSRIDAKQRWRVMVKLHPRDAVSNYEIMDGVDYIEHRHTEQSMLFSDIAVAVSGNSGIVIDLLFADIPYILFQHRLIDQELKPVYSDDQYENVCFDYEGLAQRIKDLGAVRESFERFKQRFFQRNSIINEVPEIDKRIDLLIKRRN